VSGDLVAARWRRRPAPLVISLGVLAATLAVATALRPVPLAEVLLVVLVEVIAVGLVAGRTIAALASVAAFVAVNWLLVPPYGTLQMADQQNWVTLAVFLLLAVGVSTLVDTAIAAERQAAMSIAREQALAEVLRPSEASAEEALRVLRSALHLDVVALTSTSTDERLLSGADRPPEYAPALQLEVAPDYRFLGCWIEIQGEP
jgi:two-component system sensor histidine kinase KdpD